MSASTVDAEAVLAAFLPRPNSFCCVETVFVKSDVKDRIYTVVYSYEKKGKIMAPTDGKEIAIIWSGLKKLQIWWHFQ